MTDGMRLLDEAMAATLGGEGTSLDMVVFSSCNMLNACNQTADLQRATQWCRAADDFVNTYGCPYLYVECRFLYGSVLLSTGDWVQAEHELQTAVRASEHHPAFRAPALSRLAQLRVDQGRLAEAESLVAQAAHPIATAPAAAAIHLTRGMPDAACSVLRRWLGRYGDTHIDAAQLLGLLVEASLAAGEIAEATDVADRLAAQSSDRARAEAALASGRLSRSSGETTAAIGAFEDAVVRFDQVDLPLSTGQARVQLSAVLSERAGPGDVQVAITEARAAMAVFDRLGARPDADACAAWLRSLGVAGRSGPRDVGVLSRREQEVLALVGDGLSNAEIAERLFISRKTASHHVSSILAKLDLRNRAEAAAHASRLTA